MEEMNQLKVFTVPEANQPVPKLTEMIQDLQKRRELIASLEVEIDALELVAESRRDIVSPAVQKKIDEYNKVVNRFYQLIDEIHELGCFLKDLNLGLIDFYALLEGRVVYLCWKMGEKQVNHWHEVGKGYAYRQPFDHEDDGMESSG